MKHAFLLKHACYKSMFISIIKRFADTFIPTTQHVFIPRHRNGSFLHLNGVSLKDYYRSAKIVLAHHFAHNRLLRSKSGYSSTVDKPNKYGGFNRLRIPNPDKALYSHWSDLRPSLNDHPPFNFNHKVSLRSSDFGSTDFPASRNYRFIMDFQSWSNFTLTHRVVLEVFE
jgi:hypothetical protein